MKNTVEKLAAALIVIFVLGIAAIVNNRSIPAFFAGVSFGFIGMILILIKTKNV